VLAGVSVTITDHAGTKSEAPLFYVSPRQINFLVPAGLTSGAGTIMVQSSGASRGTATIQIERVAPGLFTQNADGKGVPAALIVRIAADGSTKTEPVFACGAAPGTCDAAPIDFGAGNDLVYLILFGTGIRGRASPTGVSVSVDGANLPVEYAGAQGEFVGLDQVNVRLSPELRGRGRADLLLTVDSKPANTVQLNFR
jgi:uncharacterized protein (TIGR03437 family)